MIGKSGKIITFYSYKGGTGRSMAVSNVAWILASNGYDVLLIDCDLEAPGLYRYLRPFLIDPERRPPFEVARGAEKQAAPASRSKARNHCHPATAANASAPTVNPASKAKAMRQFRRAAALQQGTHLPPASAVPAAPRLVVPGIESAAILCRRGRQHARLFRSKARASVNNDRQARASSNSRLSHPSSPAAMRRQERISASWLMSMRVELEIGAGA